MNRSAEIIAIKLRMMDEELEFLRKMYSHAIKELGRDFMLAWYENEHGPVPKKYSK